MAQKPTQCSTEQRRQPPGWPGDGKEEPGIIKACLELIGDWGPEAEGRDCEGRIQGLVVLSPQSQGHLTRHMNLVLTGAQEIVAHSRLILLVEVVDTCTG